MEVDNKIQNTFELYFSPIPFKGYKYTICCDAEINRRKFYKVLSIKNGLFNGIFDVNYCSIAVKDDDGKIDLDAGNTKGFIWPNSEGHTVSGEFIQTYKEF